jgi:SPP1 gp7 family putative phage head morphogenesis protein
MTDYERLISYGQKSVDDAVLVAEAKLAALYRDAYKIASKNLAELYAKLGSTMTLPEVRKYSRLENMMQSIGDEYRKITGKAIQVTGDTSMTAVTGGYDTVWFNMEKTLSTSLEFGLLPVDAIRASVFSEVSGATFVKRYGKLYTSSIEKVAEEITRGIAVGQSYAKTVASLKAQFNNVYYQAVRVVRTEAGRCYTEGNQAAYQSADDEGIKGWKVWLATFDGRTRDSHARLNDTKANKSGPDGTFNISGDIALGPGLFSLAENTINCRCTTKYDIEGMEGAPSWKYDTWKKNYEQWKQITPKERPRKFKDL